MTYRCRSRSECWRRGFARLQYRIQMRRNRAAYSEICARGLLTMADVKLSFPVSGVDLTGLEKTHHLVRFTPDVDLSAAFSLVLPKTWQMEDDLGPQPNGLGQMMRIGLFLEKQMGADMTIVQVYLTRLPFEVALRDWMEYLAGVFQTQLVTLQEYEFAIGSVVDAGG